MSLPLILIVDDNPKDLAAISELLRHGHAVRMAESMASALRLARLPPVPDLILLGGMPTGSVGEPLLRQLRLHPETAGIPVILLAARNDAAGTQQGPEAAPMRCIAKPIHAPELLMQVRAQLDLRRDRAGLSATPDPGIRPPPVPPPAPADIPGLSRVRSLVYLPGHSQLYTRMLRQFADSYRGGVAGLSEARQGRDWRAALGLLHSLRGACGAVGATDLAGRSLALEQQLHALASARGVVTRDTAETDTVAGAMDALAGQLSALVSAIDQRLADERQ